MSKLTRSMLMFNVTTPIEKYDKIVGRFGINDVIRHVVAEVNYPNGSIGAELLFNVQSISDFDAKFSLATPLEFLQRLLIVGKLKPEEVGKLKRRLRYMQTLFELFAGGLPLGMELPAGRLRRRMALC